MNTEDIKAFALEAYRKEKYNEDIWVNYSPDLGINIYQEDIAPAQVRCMVHPVINGALDTTRDIYYFTFPREGMTFDELKAYVERHRNALIAEATNHMEKEDGRWTYWGDVALCVYYDGWAWPNSPNKWYRIVAFPMKQTENGMVEEDLKFSVHVADIKFEEV